MKMLMRSVVGAAAALTMTGTVVAGPETTIAKRILNHSDDALVHMPNAVRREAVRIGPAAEREAVTKITPQLHSTAVVSSAESGAIRTQRPGVAGTSSVPLNPLNGPPSTAKTARGQSATPRNSLEEKLFRDIRNEPARGNKAQALTQLNKDARFPQQDGWLKMQQNIKPADGRSVTGHYQYHFPTNTVTDVKAVHPPK